DVDCHATLPQGSCSCDSGHDITLSFCDAPSMTARGHFRQINPLPTLSACPLRSDRVRTFAPQRIDAVWGSPVPMHGWNGMTCRQRNKPRRLIEKQCVFTDEKSTSALLFECRKSRLKIVGQRCLDDQYAHSESAGR